MVDINLIFVLDNELGRVQFGITYLCTKGAIYIHYACNSVSERKLVTQSDIDVI